MVSREPPMATLRADIPNPVSALGSGARSIREQPLSASWVLVHQGGAVLDFSTVLSLPEVSLD